MTLKKKADRQVRVERMKSDRSLPARIRVMIGESSARSFANKAGISDSTLRSVLDGASPTVDTLVALARAGGRTIDWLATGEDPEVAPTLDNLEKYGHMRALLGGQGFEGFAMIPRYDVKASAGYGAFNDTENVVDYMAFREDWVRRTLRVDPSNLVLITAIGDSMEPAIRAGDLLLIDTGLERVIDDAIYVLVKNGEVVVKRVQQFFNGAVTVKSDNCAYVEETLSPQEAKDMSVAGRVRWIGRII
jgi:phage repressor protein C with HTH and peptisase S24 domain